MYSLFTLTMDNFLKKILVPILYGALAFLGVLFALALVIGIGRWVNQTVANIPAQFWADLPFAILVLVVLLAGLWLIGMGVIYIVRWFGKRKG